MKQQRLSTQNTCYTKHTQHLEILALVIAPERIATLFDTFSTSGKAGGTGLGLAFCKRVMAAFGGTIQCHSELGAYTGFVLSFPLLPPTAPAQI